MKTLIIIPAYNEQENIETVVENLKQNYSQYDYIIVNDGSKDHTAEICRKNKYHFIDLPVNLGLAGAFQAGLRYAYAYGYDMAIQYDGDGQHDAKYISSMIDAMQSGNYDIVIGSRFCDKKKPRTMRMLGNTMISFAIRLTTGKRINDPTAGMRLFNKRMIHLFSHNINYGPEPDTISYLLHCGANISEVQVEMHERVAGVSYLSMGKSIRYMLNMFISILFVQFFRPKEMI
ncbi:MAG TPA: glycosyltransferase family 2 protein [Firmicutes bacterium]|nr:glycosyltransferase family 2 protein [Bacillota bacterium]